MRLRLLGLISATALTACGGGSDSPPAPEPAVPTLPTAPVTPPPVAPVVPPAPVQPTPDPVTPPQTPTPIPPPETPPTPGAGPYTVPARTVGDFTTYTDVTAGWKVSVTERVTKVQTDGGWETADSVSQEKGPQTINVYDGKGGALSVNMSGVASCATTYAPAIMEAPYSASVGATFDFASTMTIPCSTTESLRALTSKGAVVGIESKTVPAGTFSTLKIVSTHTNLDLRPSNVYVNYTIQKTCWRDIITGLMVACNTATTSKGSGDASFSSVSELASYSHAATRREFLDPIRYAGPWSGNAGAYYGACDVNITFTGVITGSCKAAARATAVTGSVDKAGVVKLSMSVAGGATETLTGQAALFDMSGQLAGAAAPGAWMLKHK